MSPKEELVKEWLRLAEFEITKIKAEKAMETTRSIYEFILKSLPDLEKLPQE